MKEPDTEFNLDLSDPHPLSYLEFQLTQVLHCTPCLPLVESLPLKVKKIDLPPDLDKDLLYNLDDVANRDLPISRKQVDGSLFAFQIFEDQKVEIPVEIINFELDKLYHSTPVRNLKEIDVWFIAFQQF